MCSALPLLLLFLSLMVISVRLINGSPPPLGIERQFGKMIPHFGKKKRIASRQKNPICYVQKFEIPPKKFEIVVTYKVMFVEKKKVLTISKQDVSGLCSVRMKQQQPRR